MTYRFALVVGLLVGVVGIACVDMSAPKGPASISSLLLPSPSVVLGDTMRDSSGKVAPVSIAGFDASGAPITVSAQFFILDTTHIAHFTPNNLVIGDNFGVVHIVGQIGDLQTQIVNVPVTVAPTLIAAVPVTSDTLLVPITGDSATSIGQFPLAVTLHGANDSTAQGFIVRYTLVSAPATSTTAKSPAVYLAGDDGRVSTVDTSDAGGASRRLAVNSIYIADPDIQLGTKIDSAVVTASAFYKGAAVPGSPVRFVVIIRVPQT